MPKRSYSGAGSYRYGFNGKENDNDVKGLGNQLDYGFRIYDPRVGKFLSTDPLTTSYPWYTPYQFAGNMPIVAVDLDGLEEYIVNNYYNKNQKLSETVITITTNKENGKRENLHLIKGNGEYITDQNVLVRNISYDGTTTYGPSQSALNKSQRSIVEKAKKELIKISDYIYFGSDPDNPNDDPDDGEYLVSQKGGYGSKKYSTHEYSSRNIIKPTPIKLPKPTPPSTQVKPLPITSTANYGSNIDFKNLSNKVDGNPADEINAIVSTVKASGVSNYSITIFGNIFNQGDFKNGGGLTALGLLTPYSNYGELALARANKVKELLVAKGLDPSKINTQLGDPNKGMSADYKITTTTIK